MNPSLSFFFNERKRIHPALHARPCAFLGKMGHLMYGKMERLGHAKNPDDENRRQEEEKKKPPTAEKPEERKKKKEGQEKEPGRKKKRPEFTGQNPGGQAQAGPEKRPPHQP